MHKLSIIVPFRDRYENLKEFIPYMNEYLSSRCISFAIFIINQNNSNLFNKGALLNIGVHLLDGSFDYIVLQDIDQLPITGDYTYTNSQIHISPYLGHLGYRLPSCVCPDENAQNCRCGAFENDQLYGGAIKTTKDMYIQINGYSNKYEGWGGEDDDFAIRTKSFFGKLYRINGIYKSLPHGTNHRWNGNINYSNNVRYLNEVKSNTINFSNDGINQLNVTFPYTVDYKTRLESNIIKYDVNFPTSCK